MVLILAVTVNAISIENNTAGIVVKPEPLDEFAWDISNSEKLDPQENFGNHPLYFIKNDGQFDPKALYMVKAPGYTLWVTKDSFVFDSIKPICESKENLDRMHNSSQGNPNPVQEHFERNVSKLQFLNTLPDVEIIPVDKTPYYVNYFLGNKTNWRSYVPTSNSVLYKNIYDCIDLKVSGINKQIEYDFIVHPDADIDDILFRYEGTMTTHIDEDGDIVIGTQ